MARRRVGHIIRRNGRKYGQASVEIKIAKDLEKSPQTMRREDEISFYSREYPLESFAVSESASAEWAADIREKVAPETSALYEQFQQEMADRRDALNLNVNDHVIGCPLCMVIPGR